MSKKSIYATLETSKVSELKKASKKTGLPVSALVRLAIGDFLPKIGFENPLISDEIADDIKGYLIASLEFKQRSAGKNVTVIEACDEFRRLILEFRPASAMQLEELINDVLKSATELAATMTDGEGAV